MITFIFTRRQRKPRNLGAKVLGYSRRKMFTQKPVSRAKNLQKQQKNKVKTKPNAKTAQTSPQKQESTLQENSIVAKQSPTKHRKG